MGDQGSPVWFRRATYQNKCLLNCAKMRCPERTSGVTVKAGECGKSDEKQDKTEMELPGSCYQDCECPKWLDFQCGSDGRTYPNRCLFQCALRKCPGYFDRGVTLTPGGCKRRHYIPK